MSHLKLFLFGSPRLERDGEPVDISLRKAVALLAYLAVTRQSHSRDALATLFWPNDDQSKARANLRRTLSRVNTALGKGQLETDRERVGLNPKSNLWLDVDHFQHHLAKCQTHDHPPNEVCSDCLPFLTEAVSCYTDDFLAGFTLSDCPDFDEWQFFQNESLRQALASALERLVQGHRAENGYKAAIPHARRWLVLDPLHEPAHRQLMELYAQSGQRAAAVRQYNECVRILDEEFGVSPAEETIALYEAIKTKRISPQPSRAVEKAVQPPGPLAPPPGRPPFFKQETDETESSPFVARERELVQLNEHLEAALVGHRRVVFVTGEAGHGKTTLLQEFARRAQVAQPELIVAGGNCNAYAGVGDPYLPFREVMGMLSGDVETRRAAGTITKNHAGRLWRLLPDTVRALVDDGPNLIDVFVSGAALIERAAVSTPGQTAWLEQLKEITGRKQAGSTDVEQRHLFDQYAAVLRSLAARHPLLIILDDLQWADAASISLLFHLGRRLEGSRSLVAGAYRPDEVAIGRDGERHPLEKILNEFKRTFGDVWIDLAEAERSEGRAFVDLLLDTEPNRLGEEFRQALFEHTGGHPLFTVELLQTMQERGDLVQDAEQRWVKGPALNWETLPARVEGVIEERIGRLEPELRELLSVASVEGESFTAEVVAQVQQTDRRQLLRHLSQELEKRHRLVQEQKTVSIDQQQLSRYSFAHILFQRYLYHDLSTGERRLLHREVAQALEQLYTGQPDEIAMELARHYLEAGEQERAVTHLCRAGDRAQRLAAPDEAIHFYRAVLEHWSGSDQAGQAETLRKLGECLWVTGRTQQAQQTFESSAALFKTLNDPVGAGAVQRLIGQVYLEHGEWTASLQHYQQALAMLEQGPESVELARVISAISQVHFRHGSS